MASTGSKPKKTAAKTDPSVPYVADITKTADDIILQPETASPVIEEKLVYRVKKDLDPNIFVTVKNGFNGPLVYKNKKTGERFHWEGLNDEQEMELSELRYAKNTNKAFFINNWFLFDDPEIIDWLGMSQYYKYALNANTFNELFEKSPEEIEDIVSKLSAGQKTSVALRAKQLIAEGGIDSIKVINALEKSLAVELIEH